MRRRRREHSLLLKASKILLSLGASFKGSKCRSNSGGPSLTFARSLQTGMSSPCSSARPSAGRSPLGRSRHPDLIGHENLTKPDIAAAIEASDGDPGAAPRSITEVPV